MRLSEVSMKLDGFGQQLNGAGDSVGRAAVPQVCAAQVELHSFVGSVIPARVRGIAALTECLEPLHLRPMPGP
jgi:hypothetical protein